MSEIPLSSYLVRPATLEDLPAIQEIYNQAGVATTASFDLEPWTEKEARAWFFAHGPAHPIFVAEMGGRVAGWASLSPYASKEAYRYTVEDSVYVHRDFRSRGLGRVLLRTVLEAAASLGYRAVVAKITRGNDASLALHRQAGFIHVGTLIEVGYKFDRWLDVDLLELLLQGPKLPPAGLSFAPAREK